MKPVGLAFLAILLLGHMTGPAALAEPEDDAADTSLSAKGDADRGRRVFFKCKACHSLEKNKASSTINPEIAPNLSSIFGRKAGGLPDFPSYSAALKDADFIWTEKRLDRWMKSPNSMLVGNKMAFSGIRKEQDRYDLLAYLRQK
ncbi:hypothetical protein GCM10007972_19390 [Iodidimonas muriae]|uniref:Cytochrome c domain-containing protein n=1 Tax=Iodidimonas muriae TaxID=261467 RepID=A0ABQ2LEB2_9PROT|nr:c-type cytochrome [Iodidimonas muriae]GER07024.1 hypothetical protein JCM17843_13340 [Kordiimonadales bacterium JCM 17843]GGO13301.1 hypothetical protein GCM10007972_19390 [Iodidimonas muriae]